MQLVFCLLEQESANKMVMNYSNILGDAKHLATAAEEECLIICREHLHEKHFAF